MQSPSVAPGVVLPTQPPGCQRVAGALIVRAGRVFVHRRTAHRALFPGCWDIVGGHVDEGEDVLAALAREVTEETGWTLTHVRALVYTGMWTGSDERVRQELDFVVTVAGNLDQPRLEPGKHDAWRWLRADQLSLLVANRLEGDVLIRDAARAALQWDAAQRESLP